MNRTNRLRLVRDRYLPMLRRWLGMARGRSYWHVPQPIGRAFVPDRLDGYFNDLTAKIEWIGPVDADGLPLHRDRSGASYYFPTTVLHKALGHWDTWILSGRKAGAEIDHAVRTGAWLQSSVQDDGGWPVFAHLGTRCVNDRSAMVQGEAVSLLVRLWTETQDSSLLETAERAIELMMAPIAKGGTARFDDCGRPILEEVPLGNPRTILNGWIYGLFGLYDLSLVPGYGNHRSRFSESLDALADMLPVFDRGYWSNYDNQGSIASPFYHHLHIAQLDALQRVAGQETTEIGECCLRWRKLQARPDARIRAVIKKIAQKLIEPPEGVPQ